MTGINSGDVTAFTAILGSVQVLIIIVIVLLKRSLAQFDDHNRAQDDRLDEHTRTLNRIDRHMARVEEYMDNAKSSRTERSKQIDAMNNKLDSIIKDMARGSK